MARLLVAWWRATPASSLAAHHERLNECRSSQSEQERAAWAEVRSGARAWVEENVYYVTIDPGRYRAAFGIDP